MDIEQSGRNVSASTIKRRRRPRCLLSQPMTIHPFPNVALSGISIEMSESGMSAMVNGLLEVGQTVELEPIAGDRAPALVRHRLGQLYGFEFVGLTHRQVDRIAEACKKLGRQRSHANIRARRTHSVQRGRP